MSLMPDATTPSSIVTLGLSVVRTVVPVLVGLLVSSLANIGATLDNATATVFVEAVVVAAYYAIARVLETKVAPAFGWLLGAPKPPTYPTQDAA
jgi:hypothetical protein